MTEVPTMTDAAAAPRPIDWADPRLLVRVRRRHGRDAWLRAAGLTALGLAVLMLAILVGALLYNGWAAFTQTHVTLEFEISPQRVKPEDPGAGNFRAIVQEAVYGLFPEVTSRRDRRELMEMISSGAPYLLRDRVMADPGLIGRSLRMAVPVSDPFDQLAKGLIDRNTPESRRRVSDAAMARFDRLVAMGLVSRPLNVGLITNADSRFPELAGLKGALWGSFYALLVCFLISFPVGIAAAIYLEEFAPRNRWTDLIEININNLAAVPSVVFGLLALAVFLGWFGLPRSAPLVGGMTLALMTLPTIIIATRAAIKAVPPSIREAALGLGASRHQVVFDHVLPLAMPGILTGTIIGLAQALGETAPLLLIGMNAFITQAPDGVMSPATALPTQIFIWADSPERGFVSRTAAAICVLLLFLVAMNATAIYLRRRFAKQW
ncbi:MAG: phosphate ABC transporter permease PstA [Alphaproteobacteria bacterium]|nr:MAG: phosphate ABC transporter permease PstA [Alphaproteobacteria bacterium]